ncbi:hypothetical protein KP509_09G032700 [Ceratopteris richardii]|uniref:Peroxin-5 n=1 Tax=Ceratopteris richardii TaxID=49495 RepID=A0A8T2U5V8_CERRI|nr:hypothetical protein KP509_09G032700 [Ceratopteris richardii]KAH7429144.1 hypothetical protein KP509_09G032700 [Ceratopteris richardii]KAH7429145.1 hypothetical protein KP509_09G032700 [Ceratopteris richardii]KAH7429146.1 hypothetical protein KP509_09G032700 [Ceratopteris richardii]
MALRDLVMGGGACAVPGTSSSANPIGRLAESLFGSASKQERLQELPALPGLEEASSSELVPSQALPGLEYGIQPGSAPSGQVSEFMRGFHGVEHQGYEDAWRESAGAPMPSQLQFQGMDPAMFSEFEGIYSQGIPQDGPPPQILSGYLRSFFDSSHAGVPFHPVALPQLGLSDGDKLRIRNRSSVMARHVFADKGPEYADSQLNALLHSLNIEPDLRALEHQRGYTSELEEYWNDAHAGRMTALQNGRFRDNADQWAVEFSQQGVIKGPQHWAEEFQQQHEDAWANEFTEQQLKGSARYLDRGKNAVDQQSIREQSRRMAEMLAQSPDPKIQNSKFHQFVSKMSRGELIVEDNQVKPNEAAWADEFTKSDTREQWAAEFTAGEHAYQGNNWVEEFSEPHASTAEVDGWVDEFSKLNVKDWANEFENQLSDSNEVDSSWLDSYEKFVEEQVRGEQNLPSSSKLYMFADQNPYMGHPNPLKEGQELFRRGLLSEAVLALEAEVMKNPDNAEGWRLLGITHAENDDDRQSIAAMVRARDADSTNCEVLLSLGVSHTNELEQLEALKYLRAWLQHHPRYSSLIPADQIPVLNNAEVTHLFHEAARMAPADPDVHTVLGVLYNLSRDYDRAIEAFRTALQLKPKDYSLWNKLGATQANSARSADALDAYQQALDLKPNYVRAWSNMGISYANQGRYEESVRYYVRALWMNPKAENAWQYLRISLSISGRGDMIDACDKRDLDRLQKEFPL